jgi:hypothetical protein
MEIDEAGRRNQAGAIDKGPCLSLLSSAHLGNTVATDGNVSDKGRSPAAVDYSRPLN